MELCTKNAARCIRSGGILGEDRRTGEAELVVLLESLTDVLLRLAEL